MGRRLFTVFAISVVLLGCFVEDAHCQFGSLFPNNPPPERSGDNTVVCAVITRQCQIRCAERKRQGLPNEYVTWTVKILQTLVSCTTKDEKDITIGPSQSQVDIEFNVACCENQTIHKQSDDDDPRIAITPVVVAVTTAPTTPPTTTTLRPVNPPTMCASKVTLDEEIENKLFISMLFSAVSTGMTIILCFMVLIICWMFTNRRRSSRRKKEDVYNSPSFVYMRERNVDNSENKEGIVTRASMASASELSSRPLPEVVQRNSRQTAKEPTNDDKPYYNKEQCDNVRALAFQPIDNDKMFGHVNESFDSNPPPRRITFNNEPRTESKLVSRLEKRHDSMPASSHMKHQGTNTETCENFPEVNEDYEYCRLENENAKDNYSLIKGREKSTKRASEGMLQENLPSSSEEEHKELFNVMHPSLEKQSPSTGRLLRNKSMDYIDVETAYTKTMSPKTSKCRPNANKDNIVPLLAHQSMKKKETAYEFADEITSQTDHVTNQDTLPYDNAIDFHGKDGRKLVETEDL